MKYSPRMIVRVKAWMVDARLASIRLWWAHVTVTPEASSTAVLRSGTSNGSSVVIPVGGHCPPSSGVGAKLEW